MYVCLCNGVTESTIRKAAQAGIRTLGELATETGCGAGCGCCREVAAALLEDGDARSSASLACTSWACA